VIFSISTAASVSVERIRRAAPDARLWFQAYVYKDRALLSQLLQRARAVDCEALVITVDVPVLGQRVRDLQNRFTVPLHLTPRLMLDILRCPRWSAHLLRFGIPKMQNLLAASGGRASFASLADLMARNMDASVDWDDLARLREQWRGKMVLKGILSPQDAQRAVAQGFDAVAVSNHGGRQLDCATSAIASLPDIVAAVGGRVEIFLDGGVRRGSDIAKALALGAGSAMIGRATLFGVAASGGAGASRAIEILAAELDRCIALLGCPRVADLDGSFIKGRDTGLNPGFFPRNGAVASAISSAVQSEGC
jgi:(S)-mandelate dehydrogenase